MRRRGGCSSSSWTLSDMRPQIDDIQDDHEDCAFHTVIAVIVCDGGEDTKAGKMVQGLYCRCARSNEFQAQRRQVHQKNTS